MLEWLNFWITSFGAFISMLFRLPFYGDVMYGHMTVAIGVFGIVLTFVVSRVVRAK